MSFEAEARVTKAKEVAEFAAKTDEDVANRAPKKTIVPGPDMGEPIYEAASVDILSGRGANVNNHPGNKKFRALCFSRKPLFDRSNHAAKNRIATEVVHMMTQPKEANVAPSRFLKKMPGDVKGPYYAMTEKQAIAKAQQVMRDYQRPDRIALRMNLEATGQLRRRNRTTVSTPLLDEPALEVPEGEIVENPFGVHSHDVLCGRGAFVNGHVGNKRLREIALQHKKVFDDGNFSEKRTRALEVLSAIQALDPPGRFLKKAVDGKPSADGGELIDGVWEQLSEEKAIHKACQVMRDIARPDRKHREERKERRKLEKMNKQERKEGANASIQLSAKEHADGGSISIQVGAKDEATIAAEQAAVEVVDKALSVEI
ncbi:MAG: hypothetical protein SGILL_009678 [Bacillariaceae sp.]